MWPRLMVGMSTSEVFGSDLANSWDDDLKMTNLIVDYAGSVRRAKTCSFSVVSNPIILAESSIAKVLRIPISEKPRRDIGAFRQRGEA